MTSGGRRRIGEGPSRESGGEEAAAIFSWERISSENENCLWEINYSFVVVLHRQSANSVATRKSINNK